MVFVKHSSLKSDIFFNPMIIPGFLESRFFRVQVFQGPGLGFWIQGPGLCPGPGPRSRVQGPGPRSGSSVRVQVLEVAFPKSTSGRLLLKIKDYRLNW